MENKTQQQTACTKCGLGRVVFWGLAAVLWVLTFLWYFAGPAQETVEQAFTRGAYRWVVGAMTPLTQWAPFSIALVLTIALIVGFPALWAANWIYGRRVKHYSHWRGLFWGFKWALMLVPLIMVWFVAFWGAGYQRVQAEDRLHLDTAPITNDESARLRGLLLDVILRDLPPPEQRDPNRALASISKAMEAVVAEWDGRPITLPRRVKPMPSGFLMFNSTSGMCSPFTLEAQVDRGLPDTAYVSVGAHELGHIAGFCYEAEATLIGYVAGQRADDPYARYATALDAYMDLANQLPKDDRKKAMDLLPETAREDLKKAAEAHQKYRIQWFSRYSWKVYNKYLQAQGIKEGTKNYSRGITLFTYAWRKGLVNLPDGVLDGSSPHT